MRARVYGPNGPGGVKAMAHAHQRAWLVAEPTSTGVVDVDSVGMTERRLR